MRQNLFKFDAQVEPEAIAEYYDSARCTAGFRCGSRVSVKCFCDKNSHAETRLLIPRLQILGQEFAEPAPTQDTRCLLHSSDRTFLADPVRAPFAECFLWRCYALCDGVVMP